jgi:very-short-patch-repair endonuclease
MEEITKEYLEKEFVERQKSTYEIADELGTYSNKIRRLLKKYGIPLRNQSEAITAALKTGRKEHPTKGKSIDITTKTKIGRSMAKMWQEMQPNEKKDRNDKLIAAYNALPKREKEKIKKKRHEGLCVAAKEGSKIEKYFLRHLIENGYRVQFHRKGLIPKTDLEIDLFLPDDRAAIEIDGVTHFEAIYGPVDFKRVQRADQLKTGLLLDSGYVVIRIKLMTSHIRAYHIVDAFNKTAEILKSIAKEFPPQDKRFFEFSI